RYGQHLSVDNVNDLIKPSDEALDLVHEWLADNGIENFGYSPAKDWIYIYVDVETAESMLDTEYYTFAHEDGTQMVRTPKWSLPKHLHEHIDTIQPTTSFMRSMKESSDIIDIGPGYIPEGYKPPSDKDIAKVCNFANVTIDCFKTLYGTKDYKPKALKKNKIAFNNFLGEVPARADVAKFLAIFQPKAVPAAHTFKSIEIADGPPAQETLTVNQTLNAIGEEANLDAQTITGMTYPTTIYSYSTGGSPPFTPDLNTPTDTNEPYLTWVNYILAQHDVPQVISTSYGDDEQTVPKAYATRVCQSFAQLGARGISLLFSSGDGGLGGETDENCFTNDGKNTPTFLSAFPAGCPYVTAVGGTMDFEPEVAVYRPRGLGPDGKNHSFFAGGSGFSRYFDRPSYQDAVVPQYVKGLHGLYNGLYNPSGRAYPDVSAQALWFGFVWNNTVSTISGTSASCPLTSSIISLVNDALIASGRPTLGFLNPWLYSKGHKAFTDVLSGSSHGCGVDGFPVTKGWDAVTGWGTPNFPEILKVLGVKH
ncbi:putative Tripeptidyl-peptidase SED2, partial [Xylogone sp. PMI_703]